MHWGKYLDKKTIDKFDLTGKVAVVTGGAGLLGSQFVTTLREANANVVAVDINDNELNSVIKKKLDGIDNESLAFKVDICNKTELISMANTVLEKWKKIDILVNSAAIDPKFDKESADNNFTFENFPIDQWQRSLDVNLTGTFLCSQVVGKIMLNQEIGNIINLGSTYGMVGPNQNIYKKENETVQSLFKPVSYSVTKGGVIQLTRYLAAYWGSRNIRVNSLTPGGVYNSQDQNFLNNYTSKTPLGRMANKDELNGALLFLASEASSYMTGANLVIDGGWTAW